MFDGRPALPTLDAARVVLRHVRAGDVDALFAVFSDVEVMRYWSRPPFTGRAEAAQLVTEIDECFAERTLFQWGIARREDDVLIGTCTLGHLHTGNQTAELGYALGRAHWGLGLAGEALDRLVSFAFETMQLRRLEADVDPRNARSVRVLERLGFQREGHLRERWLVAGELADSWIYGLLRREWTAPVRR